MHNVLLLQKKEWSALLVLALVLLQYITFSYSGIGINGHRISDFLGE